MHNTLQCGVCWRLSGKFKVNAMNVLCVWNGEWDCKPWSIYLARCYLIEIWNLSAIIPSSFGEHDWRSSKIVSSVLAMMSFFTAFQATQEEFGLLYFHLHFFLLQDFFSLFWKCSNFIIQLYLVQNIHSSVVYSYQKKKQNIYAFLFLLHEPFL